ncbi:VOC family protein [Bacillus sp. FJAT-49732]|uniref:VOC family protein n=1 Tax=Lederbergia citrisecunda TaxID=2833583 RepID=A0A942YL97_9BACI|nr:VOC family protein [Lederbergia citrisecunda]MBS4198141.1 VOC family protein [Lederbergia citrisecunda]
MLQKHIDSLDHIQIPVKDVEESIEWYTNHLGFHLHGRPNHDQMAFLCLDQENDADNRPLFLLWKTNESTNIHFTKNVVQMPVLCFKTNDIHLLRDKLIEAKIQIASFTDEGWAYCMDFYDINGNLINVTEYN